MAQRYRRRTAASVAKEIISNMDRHRVYRFQFNDLLVNGYPQLLEEVCDRLIAAGLKEKGLSWTGQALARATSSGLLQKMAAAGCTALTYGAESFSENVIRKMDKFTNVQTMARVLKWTSEAGIKTYVNLIVGFPTETNEDFEETLDFLQRYRPYINSVAAFSTMTLTYGSPIERNLQAFNIKASGANWHRAWQTQDGHNTPDIRARRHKRLAALLRELELGVVCNYAYEEAQERQRRRLGALISDGVRPVS
jgi:radical SAM superfamily enzyme YgiQ (UPF0313 family)